MCIRDRYYRVESKLYNPCWFMLDQVIISQSMIPLMVKEQLKIITKCGKGVLPAWVFF